MTNTNDLKNYIIIKMLIDALVFLAIICLLLVLSMTWPPDSPWSPWWRTDKKMARKICKLAKISSKDLIYDLGCGDGTFMIIAAKEFNARSIGVEIDPVRFLIAKIRVILNNLSNKIIVKNKNFHKENLSKASVVSVYLVPRTLELLKQKLINELNPNARIISHSYKMKLPLIIEDKRNRIYVHKIA
jgi:ribosomal protein L11 methylase PrmA